MICGHKYRKNAACGRAFVKNHVFKLELFNLGVELILVFVVGEHFVAVGECAAQRIAEGRFSFEKDVLEPQSALGNLSGYVSDGSFIDIGIPQDYASAQTFLPANIKI